MREIRFRGKTLHTNTWRYGGISFASNMAYAFIHSETGYIEVIPETVGQFTGLQDKNGKDINEGDLIFSECEGGNSKLPVVFENGAFWLDESFKKDGSLLTLLCEFDEPLEVCGNIHEKIG